jgi:hypothetical protein
VPIGNVLVCDTRSDIKHDDTALAIDVVSISETTKLLLTCSIPHVKDDLAKVLQRLLVCTTQDPGLSITYGGEAQGVNLHSERGNVLLLKLSSQMALNERGLRRRQELA